MILICTRYAFYDEALRLHQAVSAGDEIPCRVLPDAATTARALAALRPSAGVLRRQRAAVDEWPVRPLLSVIIPCFNSRPEWLAALLQSMLDQSYPIWECLLVDDASSVRAHVPVVAHFVAEDERFRWVQSEVNVGPGGASAIGVEEARGDYFAVVDHDDVLEPNALYEMACVIRAVQPAVVYSDEVLVDEFGAVLRAEFRPDFDYALLLSHPYIVHLTFVRRALALAVGNFRRDWPICQDYDLLLRVAAKSPDFVHVPKVLYRWRTHGGSTGHLLRARVNRLSVQALDGHLEQMGVSAAEGWAEPGLSFNFFRLRRRIAPCQVRVIIPTRDRVDLLQTCLSSLASQTVLPVGVRWGLTVVDNGSVESASLRYLEAVRAAGNRVLPMPGAFNFSSLNNAAAARCEADFLLFLNNDIEVIEPGWLEAMLELMAWPDVGVVGAKLLYPETGLIQHAGVVVGFNGTAAHDHQFYPEKLGEGDGAHWAPGHGHGLLTIRECSAVTAACMLVRRSAFDEVGGFDEQLAVGFGDTDLCLRLKQRGWRTLFTPYARLIHHESASRGVSEEDSHPDDTALFKRRWSRFMRTGDPFYNRNLALTGVPYWPKEAG